MYMQDLPLTFYFVFFIFVYEVFYIVLFLCIVNSWFKLVLSYYCKYQLQIWIYEYEYDYE